MATYYIRTTGSDSNAGTSAGAAWLTIGKAMSTLVAGDTCYVGAGTYRVSTALSPTNSGSAGSAISIYGDVDGSKTGDSGEVVVTSYSTNDSTAPSTINVFEFPSKSYWTLGKLAIHNGASAQTYCAIYVTGSSTNLTFQDLNIHTVGDSIRFATNAGLTTSSVVERCQIFSTWVGIYHYLPGASSGSDYNVANTVRNCVIDAWFGCVITNSNGLTTQKPGGITFTNCYIGRQFYSDGNTSTTYPMSVYNSLLVGNGSVVLLRAGATGQIVENYNVLVTTGYRTNVTAGANSVTTARAFRFSMGHEALFGGVVRPRGEFPAGSPLLTWGGTSVPTDDMNGVTRPASGAGQSSTQQALGPFERGNNATRETTITRTGGTAIKIAGPGYQDFELAVTPMATTVMVYGYKDATYGTAATAPQMIVTNGGEAGVAAATATLSAGTATWGSMALTFTPTSAGIVTVRLQSNATVGTASAYFDDFSVS